MGTRCQIEIVDTITKNPRFTLEVDGVKVRVTREGTDDEGRTHFELAGAIKGNIRDVFPQDRGYVEDGYVYARRDQWDEEREKWTNTTWEYIGSVEYCALRVGDSVTAELADKVA